MLRSEANASHEIAFRPLVDLSFPKMNGPLLASVPKKAFSRNGNCASLWSSKVIWETGREYSWNNRIETFVVYPDKEVAVWLIFTELPKLTSPLLIVSHNMIVKSKIGVRSIAWLLKTKIKIARALSISFLVLNMIHHLPQTAIDLFVPSISRNLFKQSSSWEIVMIWHMYQKL